MYANGMGILKNLDKAVYWLRKSSDQGNVQASVTLQGLIKN